jgi:hypothetical protein
MQSSNLPTHAPHRLQLESVPEKFKALFEALMLEPDFAEATTMRVQAGSRASSSETSTPQKGSHTALSENFFASTQELSVDTTRSIYRNQNPPQVPATERRRPVQFAAPPRVGPNGERQRRSKKTEPGPFGPSGDKTLSLPTAQKPSPNIPQSLLFHIGWVEIHEAQRIE